MPIRSTDHPVSFGRNELMRRGWSRTMIEGLFGAPDQLLPNRQFPGRADMTLFRAARVP
jgi:hypothetical protein